MSQDIYVFPYKWFVSMCLDSDENWTTDTEAQQEEDNEKAAAEHDVESGLNYSEEIITKPSPISSELETEEGTVKEEEIPDVLTMLDVDSDMGMIPTPAESKDSVCTEGKLVHTFYANNVHDIIIITLEGYKLKMKSLRDFFRQNTPPISLITVNFPKLME